MALMSGISAPQLTPFREDGSVDVERYAQLSARISRAGVTGIFVCGTTGEFANLTLQERKLLLPAARQGAGSNVRLMYNVTALNKGDMAELIDHAKKEGADCLSITPPYYHSYDADTLTAYFKTAAAMAEGMPLYLYNIPGMAKNPITPAILAEVSECPNIVGVKDSCMDHQNLLEYMALVQKPGFEFITGNDAQVLTALQAGAAGGVIAMASVFPELCQAIYTHFQQGELAAAKAAQDKVMALRGVVRSVMPVMAHKAMLEMTGFSMGPARFPFRELREDEKAKVRDALASLELLQ